MKINKGPEKLGDLLNRQKKMKTPAYEWQDLALRVIKELNIPAFKRSAVFKAAKENPKNFILQCLNDTKELCQTGSKWKYFFKLISAKKDKKQEEH